MNNDEIIDALLPVQELRAENQALREENQRLKDELQAWRTDTHR